MRYNEILNEQVDGTQLFYHASDHVIKTFDLDHLGTGTNIDQEGPGIYLTSSREDALKYGKYVYDVHATINSKRLLPEKYPVTANFIKTQIKSSPDWDDDLYTNWDEFPERALNKATQAMISRYGPNKFRKAIEQLWYDYYRDVPKLFLQQLIDLGYDGFILDRPNGVKHLIAFNPNILSIAGTI